jgi:glucose/arabinose dehydrogenase
MIMKGLQYVTLSALTAALLLCAIVIGSSLQTMDNHKISESYGQGVRKTESIYKEVVSGNSSANTNKKPLTYTYSNPPFIFLDNKSGIVIIGEPPFWEDEQLSCATIFKCISNFSTGWKSDESFQVSTTNNTNNTWSWIKGREIEVKPNERYEVITHMKVNNWTKLSHIVLEMFNETSKQWYQIEQCPPGIDGPFMWKQFACNIAIPENTTKIRPVLNAGWSSLENVEAVTFFDDVSMIRLSDVTNEPMISNDSNLNIEMVAEGLENPTTMAFLGQDDILVLEKDKGTVRRIVDGTLLNKPVLDVPVASKGERGMLGIAVSRDEADNRTYVFLYYTESATGRDGDDITTNKEPLGNRLYRYEYIDGKLTNPKLLLDLPALPGSIHNGGALSIDHDNQSLYLTVGNGEESTTKTQNNMTGKAPDGTGGILRLTLDGEPMQGILGGTYPLNLYYAYGIRNSFGMDFDPITGKLWDTENGPSYGDEINLVEPGFNSGWTVVQGIWKPQGGLAADIAPNPEGLVDFGGKGKYSNPEYEWSETVGPTSLKFLNSNKLGKQYENDMFVGDANNGYLYHFELNDERTKLILDPALEDRLNEKIIFAKGFAVVTDIEVGPDGYLYIVAIGEGKVYRIIPISR